MLVTILWTLAGVVCLLAAGFIAFRIGEANLGPFSSRLIALLFAVAAYYGATSILGESVIPTFRSDFGIWVVPIIGGIVIFGYGWWNWKKVMTEFQELCWSSLSFFLIAVFAVVARYCFS